MYVALGGGHLESWIASSSEVSNKNGIGAILDEDPDDGELYPLDKDEHSIMSDSTDLYLLEKEKKTNWMKFHNHDVMNGVVLLLR